MELQVSRGEFIHRVTAEDPIDVEAGDAEVGDGGAEERILPIDDTRDLVVLPEDVARPEVAVAERALGSALVARVEDCLENLGFAEVLVEGFAVVFVGRSGFHEEVQFAVGEIGLVDLREGSREFANELARIVWIGDSLAFDVFKEEKFAVLGIADGDDLWGGNAGSVDRAKDLGFVGGGALEVLAHVGAGESGDEFLVGGLDEEKLGRHSAAKGLNGRNFGSRQVRFDCDFDGTNPVHENEYEWNGGVAILAATLQGLEALAPRL